MWQEVLFLTMQVTLLMGEEEQGNTICAFMNVTVQHPRVKVWPQVHKPLQTEYEGESLVQTNCRFCHAISVGTTIVSQGCWLSGDGCSKTCRLRKLIADTRVEVSRSRGQERSSRQEKLSHSRTGELSGYVDTDPDSLDISGYQSLSFCCCEGDNCNTRPVVLEEEEEEERPVTDHSALKMGRAPRVSSLQLTGSETETVLLVVLVLLLLLLALVSVLLIMQSRSQAAKARAMLPLSARQKPGLQALLISKSLGPVEDTQPLLVGLDVRDLLFSVDQERGEL